MEPSLGYTGIKTEGHNLWPYKLVTRIFEDAQATADERGNIEVILHTKTSVTGFERAQDTNQQQIRVATTTPERRWKLQTPRGSIACNYVVHATNAYAGHLLPFLAGQELSEGDSATYDLHQMSNAGNDSEATATSPQIEGFQHILSQSSQRILPKPKPRGAYGIIPTRGQVGAIRASVGARELGWRNSWFGGASKGQEYWFPRYQGLESANGSDVHGIATGTGKNETERTEENTRARNPLIILGGGRHYAGGKMEHGETDDGVLNERVSKALQEFLPRWFPGKFSNGAGQGEDGWEMEWVSKPLLTFLFLLIPFIFESEKGELISFSLLTFRPE